MLHELPQQRRRHGSRHSTGRAGGGLLGFGPDGKLSTGEQQKNDWTEKFGYDEHGRQSYAVSFEGAVTESVYDDMTGRMTAQRFFDNWTQFNNGQGTPTETVVFRDDAFGRRVAAIRYQGSVETGTVTRDERWVYDAQGRLFAHLSPEGIVAYGYDSLGRLLRTVTAAAPANPATLAASLSLSPQPPLGHPHRLRPLRSHRHGHGLRRERRRIAGRPAAGHAIPVRSRRPSVPARSSERRGGDIPIRTLGQLTKLAHYAPDSTPQDLSNNAKIDAFQYTLRADGKWVAVEEKLGANGAIDTIQLEYTYDAAGRLVTERRDANGTVNDAFTTFRFDLASNRLGMTIDLNLADGEDDSDKSTTYQYDANDRLELETTAAGQTTAYVYDRTQQTSKTISLNGTVQSESTFTYDLRGRMVTATSTANGTTTSTQYRYDDAGTRIAVVTGSRVGATATTYLTDYQNATGYSQTLVETTANAAGVVVKRISYTVGLDQISQTTTTYNPNEPEAPATGSETLVFHADGHGSVRVLTDLAAALSGLTHVLWALEKGYAASANWAGDWYPRAECRRTRL